MTTTTELASTQAHLWRSPLLGAVHQVQLDSGTIEYFERGVGPTLVFAHGWLSNANLWRTVVEHLSDRFRCITLDLPLGAHRVPMGPVADLTPDGCGRLIAEVLDALGLQCVTLIGNDSGGAYSQIATSSRPQRVARLVLNSCETPYDEFPPPPFDGLPALAQDAAALGELFEALRDRPTRAVPQAYGLLIKHPLDDVVSDSYALPSISNPDVLKDTAKVMASATSAPIHQAGRALMDSFKRPVLLVWGPEDPVFSAANAQRYADQLTNARVVLIGDAYSFTPEDQPLELASAIADFCTSEEK